MRKIILTILAVVAMLQGLWANSVIDTGAILDCISETVTQPNPDFTELATLSRSMVPDSSSKTLVALNGIVEQSADYGDERISCASAMFVGIYYLNSSNFDTALHYLSIASGYSHKASERDYIDFLKAVCYSNISHYDVMAPCLENIMSYDFPQSDRFSQMLYCESLRLMASYYRSHRKISLALRLLTEYCAVSDTLICGDISLSRNLLPEFLRNKYYERRAVPYFGYALKALERHNKSQGMPVPLLIAISLSSLLVVGAGIRLLAIRRNRIPVIAEPVADTLPELDRGPIRSLLSNTSNAMSVVDSEGHLTWVNSSFEKLYGYTLPEFILTFGDNAFVASKIDGRIEAFENCIANRKAYSYMSKVHTGYNTDIWVRTTITPIIAGTEIDKFVVEDIDISYFKNEAKAVGIINQQLQASLRNASEIQKMLMPGRVMINKAFDNFVIYSPKDFVSGDFYWYHEIDGSHYFAVGDCTGHGPSASLLSVLSTKSLDDIILTRNVLDPKEILNALDEVIIATLRQKDAMNCDGLDITVCKITPNDTGAHVTVAGAQSYMIYHSQGETVLLKGAKRSIGGIIDFQMKHQFVNRELDLPHGARIYMTSDGIIDQNNNARRSLGSHRFCDIIKESALLEITLQKEYIESAMKYWAEGEPQRDDICVLGLEIR
ncbi:MAG: SpoIIE family protein phosphatase [Bacteroidales bacterium]|nr:SpoIIE family protein phosphatase [Bacteroidales bacterium]